MQVFYVDCVVLFRCIVPRSFPAFKNWTFKLLSKREHDEIQSGGFGYGHVDTALQLENALIEEDNLSIPGSDVPQPQEENTPMPKGLQGLVNEITSHTRTITTGLLKVARLVENAPTTILEDDSLGLTHEEQTQCWDDASVVAREYNECEQREEGEEVQLVDDGALGDETTQAREGSEHRAHEGEGAQAREADTTAQADEVTPYQVQQGSASNPPLQIHPKDQGKRPVVEYSPVRPRQHLSIIDVNAPINATEETARKWVFENPHPDTNQELFKFESRVILWSNMLLLKPNTKIPTTIIDAWVAILNNNGEDRLLARLFASTWTTLYTVVNPLGDEDERYKKFIDSYLVDKSIAMETRWQNIQHISVRDCLQAFLFKFLSGLKSTYKAKKIEKLKVKKMKMAWRDNRNKIDCGVFLMRHMETFRGQLPELCNCGLQKENKDQLNALRVKYLTALMMSDLNEHREQNIQQAAEFELEG
nr:uncharacterized protein LOC109155335 [Ipomoea trifida]